jgi:hypothetical protein
MDRDFLASVHQSIARRPAAHPPLPAPPFAGDQLTVTAMSVSIATFTAWWV